MEENIRVLDFNSWKESSLNEDSLQDKAINWLSKKFGGSVSKLDGILDDIRKIENEYADEWEDVIIDLDKLQVEKTQAKSDPAEIKKLNRMMERKNRVLDALLDRKKREIKELKTKAAKIYTKNSRLTSYWELEAAKMESDIAEDLYKKAKDLSDDRMGSQLYRKYEVAMQKAKDKDEEFRKKYGSLVSTSSGDDGALSDSTKATYLRLDNVAFENRVRNLDPSQVKNLIRYLTRSRNEEHAKLDIEREKILSGSSLSSASDSEKKEKIREIENERMTRIRDMRTKISIARRYD